MPSVDRENSHEQELVLKHQPSFSDSGRASVPMWDSSDPDRAPPPLPLNPGSSSPVTKPNTSKNVAAAAEALAAKARESVYTVNPPPPKSPEKSLIKGQHQKRLQSIQNGTLSQKNSYTDVLGSLDRSPERSPERFSRASGFGLENRSPGKSPTRSGPPTPGGRENERETPSSRPSRPALRPILGENTPPSSTMLALQNMATPKDPDSSLADITNSSTPHIRNPQTFDGISSQILSLTSIATNLQREMAQLSRRSKDNATDLVSLKEATNSRDEDIRKSLKELVSNISTKMLDPQVDHGSRNASSYNLNRPSGSLLLDNKAYNSPTMSRNIPRVGSPSSFGGSDLSSNAYNMDGAAGIALLEKIWRDMGTKEGQEQLIATLSEIQDQPKPKQADPAITRKLEEILNFLKDSTGSRALVPRRDNGNRVVSAAPKVELDFNHTPAPLSRASRELTPSRDAPKVLNPKATEFINDDMQKMLKRMKDSITESGGLTAEVKAHLRELRGEVLGMGRDIARRLEQAESTSQSRGEAHGPDREEIAHIVQEGLGELREHMESLMRERRRQSSSSMTSRHSVDGQDIYAVVKNALIEFPLQQQVALQQPGSGVEREDILNAVREAWETYKPEIELQNFGLEREEILECLKEGLQKREDQEPGRDLGGATYEEVLDAVREGLEHFNPPAHIETEASVTREEILEAVRECLDSYEFPTSNIGAPRDMEMTRDDVLDAVKEGMANQATVSREIEFNRDDLFDAIKAGLEGAPTPMGGVGEKVMEKMEELIDDMRVEFKQYSVANGGDTEQVLDAMKDGLEVLRADIESYVDRAADVTGKDEIIDTIRHGLEHLRGDLEGSISNNSRTPEQTNSGDLLDAMDKEFGHLRQTIATSMVRSGGIGPEREEILDIIREGLEGTRNDIPVSRGLESGDGVNTINIMREEFEHLRETLATTMTQSGGSADKEDILEAIREGQENLRTEMGGRLERPESIMSSTSELLDAFNDGLDGLRADMEKMVNKPLDMTVNYEILETLKEGLASVRADVDLLRTSPSSQRGFASTRDGEVVVADEEVAGLHRTDIGNLEMMITQLRIKVEALDNMPPPMPAAGAEDGIAKEHIASLEAMLKDVQSSVADIVQRDHDHNDNVAMKEDIEAVEILLRNTKAKVDEFGSPEAEGFAKVAHMETLESILNETRDAVQDLGSDGASRKDIGVLEALLKEVRAGLEELREKGSGLDDGERVTKTDIEALETLCMDTRTQIDELNIPDPEILASKQEVIDLAELIRDLGEQTTLDSELKAQASEARKTEHGGIADKVEDVKLILEDVREELKAKIQDGHQSMGDIAQHLEVMSETISAADVTSTVNELRDTIKSEFMAMQTANEGAKDYHEQNHSILLSKHVEYRNAIIEDLNNKLDARFDEIMTKYDDTQIAAQEKEKALGGKDAEQAEALNATKTVAEDLRLLIDTLGATVTESCDRMSEDSRTLFNRVEEAVLKLDELLATDGKAEHQSTRAEISNTLVGIEAVQAHAADYHPRILDAVKDVLSIVGQHYEQAKTSSEEIKSNIQAIPGSIPLPAIAPSMPSPEVLRDMAAPESYDDSQVHAKLDQLISHASDAGKSAAEVGVLEQIREQVAATSSQLGDFMLAQRATFAATSNIKAKEAEEAAIALEKRTAQKEVVEMDIVRLSGEREALHNDVGNILKEKDELAALKSKMQADLSSLETALQIRREELHVMEARADGLERRILDGVLDHSRSLLTTSRPQSSLKEMNLKRVTSTSSNVTSTTRASTVLPSSTASALSSGVGMAMRRRQPPRTSASNSTTSKDRRILSLSTLGANKGTTNDRSMMLAQPSLTGGNAKGSTIGAGGLKRSHSVKSNFPVRKTSWGGTKALNLYTEDAHGDVEDKENSVLDEADEDEIDGSEAGTERRTSYSGTYTGTGSYGEGSIISSREDDKRTSYAASTVGTIGTKEFAITEDGHSDAEEQHEEPKHEVEEVVEGETGPGLYIAKEAYQQEDPPKEMVVFGHNNSDSGIGTDMPTAQLESGSGASDYFKGE